MPDFAALLAMSGLESSVIVILAATSFLGSTLTAALGLGGGSLMIAVMSIFMPAAIAVPVHGGVQLGSNVGRATILRKFIDWKLAGWFALGSAIGAPIGGQVASLLPDAVFKALIGLFLLYVVWGPKPKVRTHRPWRSVGAGGFTAAIGMVVGVSGPLVISFLSHLTDRREIVATHALLMSIQNMLKVATFTALGFAFGQYLPLLVLLIACGFAGTLVGTQLLHRLPERAFRVLFRVVITVIALDLLRRSAGLGV